MLSRRDGSIMSTTLAMITVITIMMTGMNNENDVPYGVATWPERFGNHRAFLDLVAAKAFCFLIFFSSAPIVRATNYDKYRQEARGNRRDGCSANLAHPI